MATDMQPIGTHVPDMQPTLTFGQKCVGLTFNPSGDAQVTRAKQIFAEAIDMLGFEDGHPPAGHSTYISNVLRTGALNAIIAAQMAVVKFLTWND